MARRHLFTSESVSEGHPDKVCDAVSDAVLDEALRLDPYARVACETAATTDYLVLMGEITCAGRIDFERIARDTVRRIGYDDPELRFDADGICVDVRVGTQSPDIAMGVDVAEEKKTGSGSVYDAIGAGDQGLVFGCACDETEALMPAAITWAHRLTKRLAACRRDGSLPWLRPDGKGQVTVEYREGKPARIDAVVLSAQHADMDMDALRAALRENVILPALPEGMIDGETRFYINPTGRFCIGGPHGDSGLTGRKIIVDTYGGYAPHGGGAFSGKDPTKVDRSAAYMARYAAKNVVAAGLAGRCQIQVSYAIGVARPMSLWVDCFGTERFAESAIAKAVEKVFDFRPAAIIDTLDLRRPIFSRTAAYGHFGENVLDMTWERTDRTEELRALV